MSRRARGSPEISRKRALVAAAAAAGALVVAPRRAAAAVAPDVLAAAKREGAVVWYNTLEASSETAVTARWKEVFPEIAFQPLRLSEVDIPPRVLTEQRGGHYGVDLVDADPTLLGAMRQAGALDVYRPNELRGIAGAVEEHGWWSVLYNNTTVTAWNPQKLKEHGLTPPATLDDLTHPAWHGRIGLNASALNWFIAMVQTNPRAEALIRGIGANAPLITTTHSGTVAQLEAGEFDITPTVYGYLAQKEKDAGKPIDYANQQPMIVYPASLALAKNAPHPNAARVLYEWLASRDGQQTICDASGRNSLRRDVRGDLRVFDPRRPYALLHPVPPERYAALTKDFHAILGIQGGV